MNMLFNKKCYYFFKLIRIHQPIGFFLLLWPTLWSLWIVSKGVPDFFILVLFVLGVLCMRSAGCVINDYIDRNIDGHVYRTKNRPLPNKKITKKEALIIFIVLIVISAGLIITFNIFTIFLSLIALILSILYPYLKRYIYFPQLILGLLFSWPIVIVFTAMNHVINITFWLLFVVNTIWTVLYDTQYAMVDRDDDQYIGIKSLALLFGNMDKFIMGILQLVIVMILGLIGWQEKLFSVCYYVALLGVIMLFIWQQILMCERKKKRYFQAFLSNNYIGMLVFLGIACSLY